MRVMDRLERLRAMYDAFNARDLDRLLDQLADDVDWPNAWEGGREIGREAVGRYWRRQWATLDPRVETAGFDLRPDGRVAVAVSQTVHDLDGTMLFDGTVTHVYTFSGALVSRMDVEE